MDKPRIAFVDAASFVLAYDRAFLNAITKSVDIDFYFSKTNYSFEQIALLDEKIKKYQFAISRSCNSTIGGVLNYFFLLFKLYKNKKKYSYVHFNWSIIPWLDRFLLPIMFGRKLIYTLHNLYPHGCTKGKPVHEHTLSSKCSKLVLVSEYVYKKTSSFNQERFLLRHGISSKLTEPSEYLPSACVFVGNVKPYKGISQYIGLAEKRYGKERYQIFGKWDAELSKEKARAKNSCEVTDKYLDDHAFDTIFRRGDSVVILPYLDISQSGILYNVMSSCTPFIASDRGDFSDLAIKMGYPQILFEQDEILDMERALEFCLDNHIGIKQAILSIRKEFLWKYDKSILRDLYHV